MQHNDSHSDKDSSHDSHGHSGWKRLGDGSLLTEDADTGLGHIVSVSTYTWVYFSLIVLTGVTLWAAYQDFGIFNIMIALLIASVKAGVVTLIFMHLNYESKIIWGIVIYPLFIVVLIIAGTLGDASVEERFGPMRPMKLVSKPKDLDSAHKSDAHSSSSSSVAVTEKSSTGH